ncbi:hypothetical protein ACVOZ6_003436 [Escherichia coli]
MNMLIARLIGLMFFANAWLFVDGWRAWKAKRYPDAFDFIMSGVACYSAIFLFPAYGFRVFLMALALMVITKALKMVI